MTYHVVALAIIFFFGALAYFSRASLYSPLVISCFSWFIVFALGLFFYDNFFPLQTRAFIAWLIWFLVTSSIFYALNPSVDGNVLKNIGIRSIPISYEWVIVFLIVLLIYRIWVIGSTGPSQFFLNLRLSSNGIEDYEALGIIGRFYPLVFSLFIFENIYSHAENKHLRIILWLWMLLYAIASMGKFAIITPIFIWVVINGLQGKIKISKVFRIALVSILLMLFIHLIRSGDDSEFNPIEMLAVYIYSPIVALGYYNIDSSLPFGSYVFRFIYAVGHYFSLTSEPLKVIMPYVSVPLDTNVYTVLRPFYHDFGYLGVLLFSIFYGLMFSLLFLFAIKKSELFMMLFLAVIPILLFQFFEEVFFTVLSGNLQITLSVLFIYFISIKRDGNVC